MTDFQDLILRLQAIEHNMTHQYGTDSGMVELHRSNVTTIQDAIEAIKIHRQELDDRPYWHWRAMLDLCAEQKCERPGDTRCPSTADCITEWCTPCASRIFLSEIHERSKPEK